MRGEACNRPLHNILFLNPFIKITPYTKIYFLRFLLLSFFGWRCACHGSTQNWEETELGFPFRNKFLVMGNKGYRKPDSKCHWSWHNSFFRSYQLLYQTQTHSETIREGFELQHKRSKSIHHGLMWTQYSTKVLRIHLGNSILILDTGTKLIQYLKENSYMNKVKPSLICRR